MDLMFLGRGAAFNTKEGNTSAFFIESNELFLIDCGESVFERIIELNILDNITTINLMITHTHSDHIGSIGSLVLYSFYVLGNKANIILPKEAKYLENIENILNCFGCSSDMYNYVNEDFFDNTYLSFNKIRYTEVKHSDLLACYGILFDTNDGIVYYSGDTREIDIVKKIIYDNDNIDKLYIDTTNSKFSANVHLHIDDLYNIIPNYLTDKVYCMHINDDSCIEQAKMCGFNVVQVCKKKRITSKKH